MELHSEQTVLANNISLLGRDRTIRDRLIHAIAAGRVTPYGLTVLRDHYALTPAETLVFVAYYLSSNGAPADASTRRNVSRQLNLSENTLMHHVTSIRRKLGFGARRGSANVLMWSVSAGITNLRGVFPDRFPGATPGSVEEFQPVSE